MSVSREDLIQVLGASLEKFAAEAAFGQQNTPKNFERVVLNLSTAQDPNQPFRVPFPFRSFYVEQASDATTSVNMKPYSQDAGNSYIALTYKDRGVFDKAIPGVLLDWAAQSGKTMTIVFMVDLVFESGSQVSSTAGGVSLTVGSGCVQSNPTVGVAAVQIAPQDFNRKRIFFQNLSGASIYIGPTSSVTTTGATRGIEVQPNASFVWDCTSAMFAIAASAGNVPHVSIFS